ncbi:LD-carboxypeptidase [Arthrobacter sp. GMC3]|uniref:S66 peptidase family protein n=1 Tax=Arthrobacter sp. GMC3 TaxID=2058894 RepID=UPI000CE4CD55|nr:LD-carboxypeptidase [Arthrobacter sp. GMC3]
MSAVQLPGPLHAGDRVALISTSGTPSSENLDRAIALLESWELVPVPGDNVLATHPRAKYLAGTDQQRAADLQQAWCDDSVAGVFIVRGGYGTVRLLDHLDVPALRAARAKPLYGSSDVTGVHEFWAAELGVPTWFTPMIATTSLLDDPGAVDSLKHAVFEPAAGRAFTAATAQTLVPGTAHGVTVGGNLSLLAMTMGAHGNNKPSNQGKIGLLEDVTEDIYKLDGLLHTLLRAGWFEGLTGLALGSWKDCGELADVRELCEELLVPLGIPLVWELGFGHDTGAHSIPLGVPATLIADESPRLVLQ